MLNQMTIRKSTAIALLALIRDHHWRLERESGKSEELMQFRHLEDELGRLVSGLGDSKLVIRVE
jgi:hypothetical protein